MVSVVPWSNILVISSSPIGRSCLFKLGGNIALTHSSSTGLPNACLSSYAPTRCVQQHLPPSLRDPPSCPCNFEMVNDACRLSIISCPIAFSQINASKFILYIFQYHPPTRVQHEVPMTSYPFCGSICPFSLRSHEFF